MNYKRLARAVDGALKGFEFEWNRNNAEAELRHRLRVLEAKWPENKLKTLLFHARQLVERPWGPVPAELEAQLGRLHVAIRNFDEAGQEAMRQL
jgi:hypothetical protein